MGVYDTRGNYSPTPGVCRPNGPAKPPPEPRPPEHTWENQPPRTLYAEKPEIRSLLGGQPRVFEMSGSAPKDCYSDYLAVNDEGLSRFDYFYMVREKKDLCGDFIISFAALFNPTLFYKGGGYFVGENYTELKYQEFMQGGVDALDVSYWVNMVEITSLLGDISYEDAAGIGAVICKCWNDKLVQQFPESGSEAILLLEDDLDEVWVTLCRR